MKAGSQRAPARCKCRIRVSGRLRSTAILGSGPRSDPRPGAVAQLVARFVRIEEVRGSIPLSSTSVVGPCRAPTRLGPTTLIWLSLGGRARGGSVIGLVLPPMRSRGPGRSPWTRSLGGPALPAGRRCARGLGAADRAAGQPCVRHQSDRVFSRIPAATRTLTLAHSGRLGCAHPPAFGLPCGQACQVDPFGSGCSCGVVRRWLQDFIARFHVGVGVLIAGARRA